MNRGVQGSRGRAGVTQRALAATGLVATAAAGGLAATAAEAQAASGAVHACYNKSTHALTYSKKASCAKGSKLVTWNKQGPRGAQGAKGAQGPQGVPGGTPGYADTKTRFPLNMSTSPAPIGSGHSSPVASFTPASAGYFAVNAFADIGKSNTADALVGCLVTGGAIVHSTTGRSNSTGIGFTSFHGNTGLTEVGTDGIVYASPGKPVYEYCEALGSADAFSTAVTGQRLTAAHLTTAGKHGSLRSANAHKAWAAARNKFQKKTK